MSDRDDVVDFQLVQQDGQLVRNGRNVLTIVRVPDLSANRGFKYGHIHRKRDGDWILGRKFDADVSVEELYGLQRDEHIMFVETVDDTSGGVSEPSDDHMTFRKQAVEDLPLMRVFVVEPNFVAQ
jgi:hypothetical protein